MSNYDKNFNMTDISTHFIMLSVHSTIISATLQLSTHLLTLERIEVQFLITFKIYFIITVSVCNISKFNWRSNRKFIINWKTYQKLLHGLSSDNYQWQSIYWKKIVFYLRKSFEISKLHLNKKKTYMGWMAVFHTAIYTLFLAEK